MKIVHIDPADRYRTEQFIDLPNKIYSDTPQWVPPLATDTRRIFDTKGNPFFHHSRAAFFLALAADGSAVARLAVLNNHHYNDFNHEQTAFFYHFECFYHPEASIMLFDAGFEWARIAGLTKIIGPRGFSSLDGLGLLGKGFEHRPAFGIPYNQSYYADLVEAAGFTTESDIVSGYLPSDMQFPEKVHRISELVQKRRGLSIARYHSRSDLRKLVPQFKDLYNAMLGSLPGNVPLTDQEAKSIAEQLLWFADPRLIKVIMKDNTPIGFLFAYPDISEAVQKTKGRVYPLGWIKLLLEKRHTRWVNNNGAGSLEEYQCLGGTAILFSEMNKSITEGGFKHAEIVQIGAENEKMQRELREMGIDFYKTHRMYQKSL
ncbi:MAG: hypothetical protein FIA98_04310 [Anaerolineae bacterium]|nr:hypothetical protein [Anaerolineae bacterium]